MINSKEKSSNEDTPLTKWKNAPTIQELKQDLSEANLAHTSQKTKITEWLDNLNITGKAKVVPPKGNSAVVPKLIRKQAEWRYAALSEPFLSTDALFNVRPMTWEDRQAAAQNELVLNYQLNAHIDKTAFIDEYVRTAVDEGTVIIRMGWDFREETYVDEFPIVEYQINPEMEELHAQLAELKETSPSEFMTDVSEELQIAHEMSMEQGAPIEPVIIGYEEQERTRTVKNCPTMEICDYRNVIIDPTCQGDIENAGFIIYSFESSLSRLKKDGKYKNLDKIVVSNNSVLGDPDHSSSDDSRNFTFNDEPRKKLIVYEYWGYWDINKTGEVEPIVAAWVGNTLIRMEKNPYPDMKHPYISVQYLPVRKSVYGESDGALLEDNQRIVGAVTRGMIDVMGKSANGQTGIRKDMLDLTNRRKFDKGQDYEFNANVDPRQGVFMHTFPNIPDSAQFMLQLQNMEAESLTGVKAYSQGVSGASLGDVAAGVRGALDAASKRELGILRRLSAGIVKAGRKIISMNSEFLSDEEVIRITNDEFITVRRDDLAGNFDLRLSISTAEEDNNKAEELAFMLQTMGNNMDPELSKMILSDIAKLRKMPDMAKKIEMYQPEPDPIQQEMAMLQLELLKAQIATEQARAQSFGSGAQLAMSKAGTEQVKQENIQTDTNQKALDFVEQDSGLKQQRDLEKHGEQARSQAQLKVMEHDFKREESRNNLIKDFMLDKNV